MVGNLDPFVIDRRPIMRSPASDSRCDAPRRCGIRECRSEPSANVRRHVANWPLSRASAGVSSAVTRTPASAMRQRTKALPNATAVRWNYPEPRQMREGGSRDPLAPLKSLLASKPGRARLVASRHGTPRTSSSGSLYLFNAQPRSLDLVLAFKRAS